MFNNTQINIQNTIYAPASPIQKSGIIVIRISGPDVKQVIAELNCTNLNNRHATLTKIFHPLTKQAIDHCIAIYYQSPNTFTGEDVLELNIHGGRAVLELTLDALSKIKNLRVAEPGEFSMRAFLNNKMDLTEVEGIEELINANTEAQHKQALKQLSGELKNIYEDWRESLLEIIGNIEAYIDFPDEDIPPILSQNIASKLSSLIKNIEKHLETSKRGEKLVNGLYVAIIGPTNAGKSSLINRIANKDLAIVSSIEGTTRDIIEVNLDIEGYPVTIADTAGLRESNNEIENEGIKKSISRANAADLKLILLDGSKDINDKTILKFVDSETFIVVNKTDLIKHDLPPTLLGHQIIQISIKNNTGIDELLSHISSFTKKFFENSNNTPLITKQRHKENLIKAIECLKDFTLEKDIVLAAEELRMAANYLGRITGRIDVESVLSKIFSSFCIGK